MLGVTGRSLGKLDARYLTRAPYRAWTARSLFER